MFSKSWKRPYYTGSWGGKYRKYPYYKKSGVVARSFKAAKSFKASTKNQYFNCSVNGFVNFNILAGEFISDVVKFAPYRGNIVMTGSGSSAVYAIDDTSNTFPHGGAVLDRTFRLMCAQYDQVKLTTMKVKLQPTVNIPSGWSIKLASVIDRNMTNGESQADLGNMADNDGIHGKGIFTNPGAVIQTFNSNRIAPLARPVWASDLKEKASFIDSTVGYNSTAGQSPLNLVANLVWGSNNTEFAPCFFYALQSSVAPSANNYITFSYTVEYNFVFRNPKNSLDRFLTLEARGYVNPSAKKGSEEEEKEQPIFLPLTDGSSGVEELSKASK